MPEAKRKKTPQTAIAEQSKTAKLSPDYFAVKSITIAGSVVVAGAKVTGSIDMLNALIERGLIRQK